MKRRVVVTGVGVIAPNGIGKDQFWANTVAGTSAVERITTFDPSRFSSQIAGAVKDFDPRALGLKEAQIRRMDRYVQFAAVAARLALEDAELDLATEDKTRVGVSISNAICGTKFMEEEFLVVAERGTQPIDPKHVSPYLYQCSMFNTPTNEVSASYGTQGICCTLPTGCTGGLDAAGFSFGAIRSGDADIMITGATEAPLTPIALAAFDVIGALSRRNDDPARASRPYDRKRDGFVLGEGCGTLILEELEHALARGARIYAEVVGYGSTCNAFHMTDLPEDGTALAKSIRLAMADGVLRPDEIDYISCHGSSTQQNDVNETSAFKQVFGPLAYRIPMSSLKSMNGHPLSAANAIELVASVLTLETGVMHPTINYENPDPDCDLDYIPNTAREGRVRTVLKTASGFSGIHSAMVLREAGSA